MLILPLFLRSHPLPPGPLADDLHALAARGGVRVRALRVLEASAKTSASNAFVAGHGPTRRIMLFDTLLGDDPEAEERLAETRSVLAHELGHHAQRRPLAADRRLGRRDRGRAGGGRRACSCACPTRSRTATTAPSRSCPRCSCAPAWHRSCTAIALGWYSRRRERAADAFGVALLGEGEPFARALERLCATNLAELRPPRLEHVARRQPPGSPYERIARARSQRKENPIPRANGAL